MSKPPLLQSLAFDPILGNIKLIAEAWDAGGLYQVGSFPAWNRWAEWNGRYRDDLRSFLKGDGGFAKIAAERIAGSSDMYDPGVRGYNASVNFLNCHDGFTLYDMYSYNGKHNESNGWNSTDGHNASVNFITCHDGFTLNDLYSYNHKHNEKNGWNSTDGADDNRSWNCGAEGETNDPTINNLRQKLIRNACAVLMASRGTPMFLMGDEFCNTQFGNNNPYCQDNEVSWLDWGYLEKNKSFYEFFRYMIAFRKRHTILRKRLSPCFGFPDVSFHSSSAWQLDEGFETRSLGVMFAGESGETGEDAVFLAVNAHWESRGVALPELPQGWSWRLMVSTADISRCYNEDGSPLAEVRGEILLEPRSVAVLVAGMRTNAQSVKTAD
jgi:glycogen operon protein